MNARVRSAQERRRLARTESWYARTDRVRADAARPAAVDFPAMPSLMVAREVRRPPIPREIGWGSAAEALEEAVGVPGGDATTTLTSTKVGSAIPRSTARTLTHD